MSRGNRGLLALIVIAMLALAACTNTTTSTSAAATATPTVPAGPTATSEPSPTPTATINAAATIQMGVSNFSGQTTVTIKAGEAVAFIDPDTSGGFHHLVTGTHGAFTAVAGAPSTFATNTGMAFSPGTAVGITFPNAGTFPITCTIHPTMQAMITVTH